MTIAQKITLLFVLLSAIIISLLSGFMWYFSNEFAFGDFYKRLEARVNINAQLNLVNDRNNPAYAELRNRYLEQLPEERFFIIEIGKGNFEIAKTGLNLPNTFYEKIENGLMARHRAENHFYAGKKFNRHGKDFMVIVSANDPVGFSELEKLQHTLAIGFALSILLSLLVGWYFSNYTLNPLRNIIKSVKKIKAENLHLRLDVKNKKDEMGQLAQTFNNMLARLETAFETQNNFISNASHELRTPLTAISGEVELAEMHLENPKKQKAALEKIKSEAERLNHILTSLLGLAQSGFNGKNQPKEAIRMDELLWEIKSDVEQIHPESHIQIDFDQLPDDESEIVLKANRNLIKLAITNIVNNACKYSDNQLVVINLSSHKGVLSITVIDKGIGIPQTDINHIFEPFFRASNTYPFKGYGIGLPLSLNITRLHQGHINIQSEIGKGTTITVSFPIY